VNPEGLTTMKTVLLLFLISACSMLPFPGSGGGHAQTQTQQSSTSSSSQTEEMHVNGRPVALDDEEDDDRGRRSSRREDDEEDDRPKKKKSKKDMDFGKTCRKNHECENDACFVGNGNLGYCTKMCNSWSDCPSHWECKKPGNAPQRICMQD
jgi:hypothetical protein